MSCLSDSLSVHGSYREHRSESPGWPDSSNCSNWWRRSNGLERLRSRCLAKAERPRDPIGRGWVRGSARGWKEGAGRYLRGGKVQIQNGLLESGSIDGEVDPFLTKIKREKEVQPKQGCLLREVCSLWLRLKSNPAEKIIGVREEVAALSLGYKQTTYEEHYESL